MSTPNARRLLKLEHAIGAIIDYGERQAVRPDPGNLHALQTFLAALKVISWPELEVIRKYFANMVLGG